MTCTLHNEQTLIWINCSNCFCISRFRSNLPDNLKYSQVCATEQARHNAVVTCYKYLQTAVSCSSPAVDNYLLNWLTGKKHLAPATVCLITIVYSSVFSHSLVFNFAKKNKHLEMASTDWSTALNTCFGCFPQTDFFTCRSLCVCLACRSM